MNYDFMVKTEDLYKRQLMFHEYILDRKAKNELEAIMDFMEEVKDIFEWEEVFELISTPLKQIIQSQGFIVNLSIKSKKELS